MSFQFGIIGFSGMNNPEIIQGSESDDTSTVGSYVGKEFSFSSRVTTVGEVADGDYPDDGGAELISPVTINGVTYPAGSEVEADWEFISVDPNTGYYYRITGLYIENDPVGVSISRAWDATTGQYVEGPEGLYTPGTTLTHIDGDDLDGTPNYRQFCTDSNYADYGSATGIGNDATLTDTNGTIVCFARGTLIVTDRGEVAVEDLQVGDLVVTRDHALQPIRWIGSRKLRSSELGVLPKLRPIRIKAGALGDGVPSSDLLVSPQHRVLVRSKIARKMFGTDEVLVAAKQLVLLDGIDIATDMQEVEYFHILFDRHEVVISNGAETESLFTGPEALKSVGKAALEEIFTLFPELEDPDYVPQPARFLPSGRKARKMGMRHLQNNLPLVATR
uniref:Hint domain-containing protein n=1 Tax=Paracoccus sp. TRP TaxID=412597 RepID=UPI0002E4C031|nr:Hint domain-containing protein [Paracoccus sp. TRP]